MQTIEHLEGTMTDSEEGHSSEVNLFSTRIKLETDRETSAIFHHLSEYYYPKKTRKNRDRCAIIMKGMKALAIIGNSIVDPISV